MVCAFPSFNKRVQVFPLLFVRPSSSGITFPLPHPPLLTFFRFRFSTSSMSADSRANHPRISVTSFSFEFADLVDFQENPLLYVAWPDSAFWIPFPLPLTPAARCSFRLTYLFLSRPVRCLVPTSRTLIPLLPTFCTSPTTLFSPGWSDLARTSSPWLNPCNGHRL